MPFFRALLEPIRAYWDRSIRRQLVWSFGLASACLMLGFGLVVVAQQRAYLQSQSKQNALQLAQALAVSAAPWLESHDTAKLQELVGGLGTVPDLNLALIQTAGGQIMASTQAAQLGSTLADSVSDTLLTSATQPVVLVDQSNLIDVAVPVRSGDLLAGWARVEMRRGLANSYLSDLLLWVLGFGFASILVAALVGRSLARRLTGGLQHLMAVVSDVERGKNNLRADVPGRDEIAVLATQVNEMLDALTEQNTTLSDRGNELTLYNKILQKISQGHPLLQLLEDLTFQVELMYPALRCSIYMLDPKMGCLRFYTSPCLPQFFTHAVEGHAVAEGRGSSGTAAFRGERVISTDIEQDPYWREFRELARQADIRACCAQPIKSREG